MKKLFIAALLAVTVTASAFAKDTKKVNGRALSSFNVEFGKASDVSWTATDNYAKATFVLNSEKMEVFYNTAGEKIGTSRTISMDELPVKTKRAFAKDYSGYTVKESIEFDGVEESGYYISAENEKESLVLKVNALNELTKYKATKK